MLGMNKSHLSHHWQLFIEPFETIYMDKLVLFGLLPSCDITIPFPFLSRDTWRKWNVREELYSISGGGK